MTPTQFFLDFQMLLHASGILPEEHDAAVQGPARQEHSEEGGARGGGQRDRQADAALSKYAGLAK